jgi:putative transposase
MPTSRFVRLVGIPERTYRRWQAKARQALPAKGPWPTPVRDAHREVILTKATTHQAWGHRKIWALTRFDGYEVSPSTVARTLDDAGLLLKADYQRERRQTARERKAAFMEPIVRPLQAWQLDFSEFETDAGGTWRVGACVDYYSKVEFGWHWSPSATHRDAIETVELALAEAERLAGRPLIEELTDPVTGEVRQIVLVTDNGGHFRAFRFEHFCELHPLLRHVRTRVRTPGQNGVRERAFQTLKYERLYREDIADALDLVRIAEEFRREYNEVRPHEHLAWNRPLEVHQGLADPTIPNFPAPKTLPTT